MFKFAIARLSELERFYFKQFWKIVWQICYVLLLCIQYVFPGVPPTQLSRYGNLGSINVNVLHEALDGLLPQKEPLLVTESEPVTRSSTESAPEKTFPPPKSIEVPVKDGEQKPSAPTEMAMPTEDSQ